MNSLSRVLPLVLAGGVLLVAFYTGTADLKDAPQSAKSVKQISLTASAPAIAKALEMPDPKVAASSSFSSETRQLVEALERGAPLTIRFGDTAPTQFVMRPFKATAKDFGVSLGAAPGEQSAFEQEHRIYQGRSTGASIIPSRAVLTVVNGAIAAMVTRPDGSVLQVKTDPSSGDLLALEIASPEAICTPTADGSAFQMAAPAHTESDWKAEPEIDIYAVGGDDPLTGNVPGGGQNIPWGPRYDLSLADAMLLMVLDKEVVGSASNANIEAKTAEFLAIITNAASVYEYEVGIRLRVQELVMIPDTAAYTAISEIDQPDGDPTRAGDSLDLFGTWLASNRPQGTHDWSLAALWDDFEGSEGVDQNGNTVVNPNSVGLAFLGTIGRSAGRSTNDLGTSWSVVTHEMGHNFGARHTPGRSGVMAGTLSFSNTNTRSFYQPEATNGIVNAKTMYDSSRGDLPEGSALRDPLEIPFAIDDTASTPLDTAVTLSPLTNDLANPLQGAANTTLTLIETGNVSPPGAGSVAMNGDQLTFTPASGFRGTAWFAYTIAGDLGWLHKADVAIDVGTGNSALAGTTALANDDFIGTPNPATGIFRFNPLINDEGEGYRHLRNIEPHIGPGSGNSQAVPDNAFYITGTTNLTPAKGTLTAETRPFTSGGTTTDTTTGFYQFTPAPGATGIAQIEYTIRDAEGSTDTGLITIALRNIEITSPSGGNVIPVGQGIVLTGAVSNPPAPFPPVTGTTWSGNGITFSEPGSLITKATFAAPGIYTIRLTGISSNGSITTEKTVLVNNTPLLTDDLQALWALDELSGATATDSSPSGGSNSPVSGSRLWNPNGGINAGALRFDGNNDYITVDPVPGFSTAKPGGSIGDYAVALWFRPTDLPSSGNIQMIWEAGGSVTGHNLYLLGNQLIAGNWNRTPSTFWDFVTVATVSENTWYHVVLSVSGGNTMEVYLDGVSTASGTGFPFPNVTDNNGIGAINGGTLWATNPSGNGVTLFNDGQVSGAFEYEGLIDQVAIYSRSITAAEAGFLGSRNPSTAPQITFAENPITIATTADSATLQASTNNDLAATLWEPATGPGTASIATPSALNTTATFHAAGSYTLHLTATTPDVATFKAQVVEVEAVELTFESYLDGFSLTGTDRLPGSDPDGDGIANLSEFAFGGNPTIADGSNIEPTSTPSEFLDITYRQRTGPGATGTVGVDYTISGIEYAVEIGDDLTYAVLPAAVEQIGTATDNGDGTETVTIRITPPTPARAFTRLRISEVE